MPRPQVFYGWWVARAFYLIVFLPAWRAPELTAVSGWE